jgi:hypothetical protein
MALRGRGSYNVEFKTHGNWFKFNEIIESTNILMVMGARQGQKEFAEAYRDNVKSNIATGGKRFGYPPNSPKYLYLKLTKGGPGTLLNWSRSFLNAITIVENRLGTRFMVGIPKGLKRPTYHKSDRNKLTISEYANVLEHGFRQVPPRPIFSDTFKSMGGLKGLKRFMEMALIRKFGSSGTKLSKL